MIAIVTEVRADVSMQTGDIHFNKSHQHGSSDFENGIMNPSSAGFEDTTENGIIHEVPLRMLARTSSLAVLRLSGAGPKILTMNLHCGSQRVYPLHYLHTHTHTTTLLVR